MAVTIQSASLVVRGQRSVNVNWRGWYSKFASAPEQLLRMETSFVLLKQLVFELPTAVFPNIFRSPTFPSGPSYFAINFATH